ncbi:hypothetical protein KPH14_008217 [Odynerus spinipes]|uniref:Uncharacterized protein n=1 Tax=Odynerus spinipes TaxID=1348599 RepID=A0AAD9RGF3_9HYME|nr:hypothetical protein KPH14_008217 [Odynerus spinipes]
MEAPVPSNKKPGELVKRRSEEQLLQITSLIPLFRTDGVFLGGGLPCFFGEAAIPLDTGKRLAQALRTLL